MEKEKIKELIIGHKERFLGRRDLVRREVQADIARYLLQREIILVTGVRRSGKSSLLRLICGDLLARGDVVPADILYLNFEDVRIFVTGSNAAMLSPEVATALTGRHRQIAVWPFSFREFLTLKGISFDDQDFERNLYRPETKAEIRRLFAEYLEIGGFPAVARTGDATLLEQYWRDILYRDVIARYAIKNIRKIFFKFF